MFAIIHLNNQIIMKKKALTVCCLLLGISLGFSQQNQEALRVTYEVTTTTSYNVKKEHKDTMSTYDKIKYMPLIQSETYSESIFEDGSNTMTILHSYPNGLVEDWLTKITKTVIEKGRVINFEHENIYSISPRKTEELIPAKDFVTYYLGTKKWKLPLTDSQLEDLKMQGANILQNNTSCYGKRNH